MDAHLSAVYCVLLKCRIGIVILLFIFLFPATFSLIFIVNVDCLLERNSPKFATEEILSQNVAVHWFVRVWLISSY